MGRRVLPVLFVALAAIADASGAHRLAADALIAALPFAAVAALVTFGGYIDSGAGSDAFQSICSAAIVVMLVISCAVRNSALHGVPPLGKSSLVAVVCLFVVKGVVAAMPRLTGLWPAKP